MKQLTYNEPKTNKTEDKEKGKQAKPQQKIATVSKVPLNKGAKLQPIFQVIFDFDPNIAVQ